jgi:exodeoxyribonuclease V alpha subunit
MYRGPIGVNALNEALQNALNGSSRRAEKRLFGRLFRAGDKVMQIKNNYEKEVFNGDIGYINGLDLDDSLMEVVIDGRYVDYDFSEAEELTHAYCISTHRSQGGEYPFVVIPLHSQHYMMLQRNLLYTAITRAKKTAVLVGMHKAIYIAVNNNKVAERYSGLLERLKR